jgi:hypothetical protein
VFKGRENVGLFGFPGFAPPGAQGRISGDSRGDSMEFFGNAHDGILGG